MGMGMISAEARSFVALPARESLTKHSIWPGFIIISQARGEGTRISLGNEGICWPWVSKDTVELLDVFYGQ